MSSYEAFWGYLQPIFNGGGNKHPPFGPLICDALSDGKWRAQQDWGNINTGFIDLAREEVEEQFTRLVHRYLFVNGVTVWDWIVTMIRNLCYFENEHQYKTVLRDVDIVTGLCEIIPDLTEGERDIAAVDYAEYIKNPKSHIF